MSWSLGNQKRNVLTTVQTKKQTKTDSPRVRRKHYKNVHPVPALPTAKPASFLSCGFWNGQDTAWYFLLPNTTQSDFFQQDRSLPQHTGDTNLEALSLKNPLDSALSHLTLKPKSTFSWKCEINKIGVSSNPVGSASEPPQKSRHHTRNGWGSADEARGGSRKPRVLPSAHAPAKTKGRSAKPHPPRDRRLGPPPPLPRPLPSPAAKAVRFSRLNLAAVRPPP